MGSSQSRIRREFPALPQISEDRRLWRPPLDASASTKLSEQQHLPPLRLVFRSLNGNIAANGGHLWQFEIKAKLRVESSQLAHRKDYLYHCHPHICPHPGRFPALWLLVNGRAGQHLVMRRRTSHPVGKATAT